MAFTDFEIAEHTLTLEKNFWAFRRPPLHLREKIREGQRFSDQSIELFFVRPAYQRSGEFIEDSIAKVTYVRNKDVWMLYWKRADGKWHRYQQQPESKSLQAALAVIDEDRYACFFG
jgi:hypothetical protein